MRDHNLLSHNQSAYTPTDSTVNQLVSIYHETCLSLDQNLDTQLIFFDISKAFDRVWYLGLLFKLKSIGIGDKVIYWFKSYLTNRYQQVVLNGKSSQIMELQSGDPQGAVLGPIMFLVYINISSSIVSNTKLYADDTSLLHKITDINSNFKTISILLISGQNNLIQVNHMLYIYLESKNITTHTITYFRTVQLKM